MDSSSIALLGTSYGGYLATIASALRPVRWLGLRVPALYEDGEWAVPKSSLDRASIQQYRASVHGPGDNRALAACALFEGDVLIVGSEKDRLVPGPTIRSFVRSFEKAMSLTHRSIRNADHALSDERARRT